jgi:asparagine synthase (glutamine-hydrolysing)
MCGISGFFHFDSDRKACFHLINKMNTTLQHRGPDGEGYYVNKNLALGHRRLAIIDLSTGEQPMYSDDRKIILVFNGEIYNYLELKEELIRLGNTFHTTSDTEVIINAYRTWGIDCQNHFNGMWAFALWDEKLGQLFLSRDRIGEKPLYYSEFDNTFIFGSEIKAITAFGVPQKLRAELTELYLTLSFIPAPYTFNQYIHQLMPGRYLLIDGRGIKEHTYWDLPDITEKDLRKDKENVEKEFERLFNDSVRIRMRSDVAFGAFLSGGLDSSSIVSVMSKYTSKPIETFTMGFNNKLFDERYPAKLVAKKYHTVHHEGILSAEQFEEALNNVIAQFDDPFGDASAIPTGQISKYAAQVVKMVLTGDGGDEVLSGYTIYQGEKFALLYQLLPPALRKLLPRVAEISSKPLRGNLRYSLNRIAKVLNSSNLSFENRLRSKLSRVSLQDLDQIICPNNNSISFHDFYSHVMNGCKLNDTFYKLMYFQHKVTLPGDMLTKVDRMSMASSIETRVPFLDYRIIELLYGVHKSVKMKGFQNKTILRNAIANQSLPKELLLASKKGFSVPLRDWFRNDDLNDRIKSLLINKNNYGIYDESKMEKLIMANKNGKTDLGNFIWIVTVLVKWLDSIS